MADQKPERPLSLGELLNAPDLQYSDSQDQTAQINTLKLRLVCALRYAASTAPDYMLSVDHEVWLRQVHKRSPEDIDRLFFGHVFDVEDETEDKEWDRLSHEEDEFIAEQLRMLLKDEFADELSEVAERWDLDPDQLAEDLRTRYDHEEADTSFKRANIMLDNGAHLDFHYHESVAMYVNLGLTPGVAPDIDLARVLHRLRIPVDDYLSQVRSMMEAEASDGSLHLTDWGMSDADEGEVPFRAYAARLHNAVSDLVTADLVSFEFDEPPVVSAAELVPKMRGEWANQFLYLWFNGGSYMINNPSRHRSRLWDEEDVSEMHYRVRSGYLSSETTSCYDRRDDSDVFQISAPIEVSADACNIDPEPPDINGDDMVDLARARDAYAQYYNTVHGIRGHTAVKGPSLQEIAARAPVWILPDLARISPDGEAVARDELEARLARSTPQSLGRELVAVMVKAGDQWRQAAATLISLGADVNSATPEGIRPVHVAAAEHDIEALEMLHRAGADLGAPFRGVSGNAWWLAMRSAVHTANAGGNVDARAAVPRWLMEHGVMPDPEAPHHPAFQARVLGVHDILRRTLEHLRDVLPPEQYERHLNQQFGFCVDTWRADLVPLFLEAGADIETMVDNGEGRRVPVHEYARQRAGTGDAPRRTAEVLAAARAANALRLAAGDLAPVPAAPR